MGYIPKGTEQEYGQGQLHSHKCAGDPALSAWSHSVLIPRCVWSLSHSKNQTRQQGVHSLHSAPSEPFNLS